MSTERPRHFSSDPVTDRVLEFYKGIGDREAFKTWRQMIPPDARRLWLRDMVGRVMRQKMEGDVLHETAKPLFPSSVQQRLEDLLKRIRALEERHRQLSTEIQERSATRKEWTTVEDDESEEEYERLFDALDGVEERKMGLDGEYRAEVVRALEKDQVIMQKFSEMYFTSFEKDEKQVAHFFEQQTKDVERLVQGLKGFFDWIHDEGWEQLQGRRNSHALFTAISQEHEKPKQSLAHAIDGAVVFGSSAIGPRDRKQYKKQQDLDLLFLFRPAFNQSPLIKEIMEVFHEGAFEEEMRGGMREVLSQCAPLRELRQQFPHVTHPVDAFPAILPDPPMPWWIHLCGPHRYLQVGDPTRSWANYHVLCKKAVALTRKELGPTTEST